MKYYESDASVVSVAAISVATVAMNLFAILRPDLGREFISSKFVISWLLMESSPILYLVAILILRRTQKWVLYTILAFSIAMALLSLYCFWLSLKNIADPQQGIVMFHWSGFKFILTLLTLTLIFILLPSTLVVKWVLGKQKPW